MTKYVKNMTKYYQICQNMTKYDYFSNTCPNSNLEFGHTDSKKKAPTKRLPLEYTYIYIYIKILSKYQATFLS